jgi:beta-galactosidase
VGTTSVHYIFNSVKLKEGENIIEVKAAKDGKSYEDKILWRYSEKNKGKSDNSTPVEKTEEHTGL